MTITSFNWKTERLSIEEIETKDSHKQIPNYKPVNNSLICKSVSLRN